MKQDGIAQDSVYLFHIILLFSQILFSCSFTFAIRRANDDTAFRCLAQDLT